MYRTKVNDKIRELKATMREVYPGVKVPTFTMLYDLNSSKTLGLANHQNGTMRVNEGILNEFGDLYIDEVIVHEFCHFVVNSLCPFGFNSATRRKVTAHGKEFKKVCKVFGIEGKSTTKLFSKSEVLAKKKSTLKRIKYNCSCKTYEVSTRMHHSIQIKKRNRTCRSCRTILVLAS